MSDATPKMITVGKGSHARAIAVLHVDGKAPGLMWLGGFMSDMTGGKAVALAEWAEATGHRVTRFDYSGHGASGGEFKDGTISRWLEEAKAVFEQHCPGPTILIGSSMGGWVTLLLVRALRAAGLGDRVAGVVLIAPAPDFTEELMWKTFSDDIRREIMEQGFYLEPSDYSDEPYLITRALIEDGRKNLVLGAPVETGCPVRILQGIQDTSVPWRHTVELVTQIAHDDVVLTLIKDGDHRLSRDEDIERLVATVAGMAEG
ncbi:MAG: alpha/beta hydrolase [Hyphomicrobiales bacterium]|nr:MAG: alpha/beta hydrolase [Hyphomicrobiales bacterium]